MRVENGFLKIKFKPGKRVIYLFIHGYFEALACCTFFNSCFDFIMGDCPFYLSCQAILVTFNYG